MQVVDTEKLLQSISQGFDYRPGIDTVTKGIWIRSKPFIIKSQDKEVSISRWCMHLATISIHCPLNVQLTTHSRLNSRYKLISKILHQNVIAQRQIQQWTLCVNW